MNAPLFYENRVPLRQRQSRVVPFFANLHSDVAPPCLGPERRVPVPVHPEDNIGVLLIRMEFHLLERRTPARPAEPGDEHQGMPVDPVNNLFEPLRPPRPFGDPP